MESLLPIFVLLIIGFLAVIFILNKRLSDLSSNKTDTTLLEWLSSMQRSIELTNKTLHESLQHSNQNITHVLQTNTKHLNDRLDNAARVIVDVQKNIGEMSEIGRSMKQLQDFLRSPKLRGNIGEQVLRELLKEMLPQKSFFLQYAFKSGTIVDAAIKTEAGIISIDSKFPMENFTKMMSAHDEEKKIIEKAFISDVKKHIDTIGDKYIQTLEGTIDYALMYIPSESVYYEIINNPILFDYAAKKRVLPVSPMTFYAYLRTILMGLEGQRINNQAREILSSLLAIQKEYEKIGETLDTLGRHITNSYNMYSQVQAGFTKLGNKIENTKRIEIVEIEELPGKS